MAVLIVDATASEPRGTSPSNRAADSRRGPQIGQPLIGKRPELGSFARPRGVSVGNTVTVAPASWLEPTTVVFGPGEHPAAPEGRILFATGPDVYRTDLQGTSVPRLTKRWRPDTGETVGPGFVNDNHMVKLKNGDVLHTFEALTWEPLDWSAAGFGRPGWWELTAEWAGKGISRAGGRLKIYVFRSSDAGRTWEELPGIDPVRLEMPDPATGQISGVDHKYSAPRNLRCVDSASREVACCPGRSGDAQALDAVVCRRGHRRVSSIGGSDGHVTYADPYTGKVYISAGWWYGGDTGSVASRRQPGGRRFKEQTSHLIFVSSDNGYSWKVIFRRDGSAQWRIPMSSLPSGRVGIAFIGGDRKIKMATFHQSVTWTSPSLIPVAFLPAGQRSASARIGNDNYGLWGFLSLARNPAGNGFLVSAPGWEPNLVHRIYATTATGLPITGRNGQPRRIGAPILPEAPSGDTLQGSFIEALPDDEYWVFYWIDRIPERAGTGRTIGHIPGSSAKERYLVRFQVFKNRSPMLKEPGILTVRNGKIYTWDFNVDKDAGSYMNGAVYRFKPPKLPRRQPDLTVGRKQTARRFIVPWIEAGNLVFNTITVRSTEGGRRPGEDILDNRPPEIIPPVLQKPGTRRSPER